ncbi:phage infection protein [Paenibacillus albidus]|uniref:Phage infection protein n=2 Tax=Paenibacillus albidus TaxID=2041023 RepID=A0A917CNC6_9BACL|nr:phage infection protein [Paenibacillus albidus]
MRSILRIYSDDISRIARNWPAAVIVLGLAVLPSLYAWFNILASWDPYSQTGGLPVAVANLDQGASLRGTAINLGNEIVDSLKENHNIGWTFTDEEQAISGVKQGDYYACIIIPQQFSARIATVLSNEPQKAELVYYVNEKINAVAPKITAKGASGIIEQVDRSFTEAANGAIFRIFNEIGVELQANLPALLALRDYIFKLEAMTPEIGQALTMAADNVETSEHIVAGVQARMPQMAQMVRDGEQLALGLSTVLDSVTKEADTAGPFIKQNMQLLKTTADASAQLAYVLHDNNTGPAVVEAALDLMSRRLTAASNASVTLIGLFERLNNLTSENKLQPAISGLKLIQTKFERQNTLVETARTTILNGGKLTESLLAEFEQLSRDGSALLGELIERYDAGIQPEIAQGFAKALKTTQTAADVLHEATASIPDVQQIIEDAAQGLAAGDKALQEAVTRFPDAVSRLQGLAQRIRTLEQQGSLEDLIALLRRDATKESEFFAEPVILKENRLFPIPNYGSAMSPFFSTLSLWVGALLLVSLLSVDIHKYSAIVYKSHQVYFGRFLTFWTIAIVQSLFVTIGDMALLGTYVTNPGWFIFFGVLISSLFMLIVYTLVSVFGNVGKALAIVLLVLQLSGSGGTFPIQVTPAFFQALHPFLPFTYAISAMREAVGGIVWEVVVRDVCLLGVYAALALILGLTLKAWINRISSKIVRKAKESELLH